MGEGGKVQFLLSSDNSVAKRIASPPSLRPFSSAICVSYSVLSAQRFPTECQQLRPVLIVLELAPLTLRTLKDDNKTREIQNLLKSSEGESFKIIDFRVYF